MLVLRNVEFGTGPLQPLRNEPSRQPRALPGRRPALPGRNAPSLCQNAFRPLAWYALERISTLKNASLWGPGRGPCRRMGATAFRREKPAVLRESQGCAMVAPRNREFYKDTQAYRAGITSLYKGIQGYTRLFEINEKRNSQRPLPRKTANRLDSSFFGRFETGQRGVTKWRKAQTLHVQQYR
jgi:hypothetical protein